MILQTADLEAQVGRQLTAQEMPSGGAPKVASATGRETAVHEMRYRLALLDASQRRMCIADSMAALMGDGGAERIA